MCNDIGPEGTDQIASALQVKIWILKNRLLQFCMKTLFYFSEK